MPTKAYKKDPIQKWGLSAGIRDLDTIMICMTSSTNGLSRVKVAEVLQRRNPSKYGTMTELDVKEIFNFYFIHWADEKTPWGLWADKFSVLRSGHTASTELARSVEMVLAGAKDELRMGGGEQGGAGKETQLVAEVGVEGVEDRRKVDVLDGAEEDLAWGMQNNDEDAARLGFFSSWA